MPELNIHDFTYLGKITGTNIKYSHKVDRGHLAGNSKRWIRKEMQDPATAKLEILAQEFFRVIIPHQPETRIAKNNTMGTYYILSEEVEGYGNLPHGQASNFTNGTFTGLGQVLLTSMFLQEIDLKNGNIGLDKNNRVIKIDGDWCFAGLTYNKKMFEITPEALASLPYPEDYYTFNWLDLINKEMAVSTSRIINADTSNALQFRNEVNQAILKICLLPNEFINAFVDAYMPAGGERFIQLITRRRDELLASALKNKSFNDYLKKPQAICDREDILIQMKSFQTGGEFIIAPDKQAYLEKTFAQLPVPLLPFVSDCKPATNTFKPHNNFNNKSVNHRKLVIRATEKKITRILEGLAQKIGAVDQHHFKKAVDAGMRLLTGLQEARRNYLINLNTLEISIHKANTNFENTCNTLINKARPELERDLGWGTYLTNLLKTIANAVIWTASLGQANHFFKQEQSESIKAIEEAGASLKNARCLDHLCI